MLHKENIMSCDSISSMTKQKVNQEPRTIGNMGCMGSPSSAALD